MWSSRPAVSPMPVMTSWAPLTVRDAREAAGLNQRELAARMGTSQAAVARLEAGGVGATLTTLQKVATALDLKVTVELSTAS